jgi:hypothetical protein
MQLISAFAYRRVSWFYLTVHYSGVFLDFVSVHFKIMCLILLFLYEGKFALFLYVLKPISFQISNLSRLSHSCLSRHSKLHTVLSIMLLLISQYATKYPSSIIFLILTYLCIITWIEYDIVLPSPFNFIIHQSSCRSTLYNARYWQHLQKATEKVTGVVIHKIIKTGGIKFVYTHHKVSDIKTFAMPYSCPLKRIRTFWNLNLDVFIRLFFVIGMQISNLCLVSIHFRYSPVRNAAACLLLL